jgi:hypothetical protein
LEDVIAKTKKNHNVFHGKVFQKETKLRDEIRERFDVKEVCVKSDSFDD